MSVALQRNAGRLRQVLLNLVGNAIKFIEGGEVALIVEAGGDPAAAVEAGLRFAVTDTGVGIPHDKLVRIFRAFEQEDTSTTRRYGGTGLGLTIAARLVGLMGGTIRVECEPGRGSTFWYVVPLRRQPALPEPAPGRAPAVASAPPPRPLSDLVAEDDEFNARHLGRLLAGRGHRVRLARNGREAMNLLDAAEGASGGGNPEADLDLLLLPRLRLAAVARGRPQALRTVIGAARVTLRGGVQTGPRVGR